MRLYVALATFYSVVELKVVSSAPPLRLTIDCSSGEKETSASDFNRDDKRSQLNYKANSFCHFIHNAIPKAVKDGKFVVLKSEPDQDQTGYSDTLIPISVGPPKGFPIPKLTLPRKLPKLKVPKMSVPRLSKSRAPFSKPPVIGSPMVIQSFRNSAEFQESSAEKMERFKKGVHKLLHVVKVLGQIDQYLSDRTRIIVEKLSKTFTD